MTFATSLAASLVVAVIAGTVIAEGPTPVQRTATGTNASPVTPSPTVTIHRPAVRISGDEVYYPRTAVQAGITEGKVVARLMIDEVGNVYEVIIVSAEPPDYFDKAVIDTLKKWKLRAYGDKYFTEMDVRFKLK